VWFPTRIDPKYKKAEFSKPKTIEVQLKSNFEESTIFANKYRGAGEEGGRVSESRELLSSTTSQRFFINRRLKCKCGLNEDPR
jgi:hypothetical protein